MFYGSWNGRRVQDVCLPGDEEAFKAYLKAYRNHKHWDDLYRYRTRQNNLKHLLSKHSDEELIEMIRKMIDDD